MSDAGKFGPLMIFTETSVAVAEVAPLDFSSASIQTPNLYFPVPTKLLTEVNDFLSFSWLRFQNLDDGIAPVCSPSLRTHKTD